MNSPAEQKPSRLQLVRSGNFETLPTQDGELRHVKVENIQVDPNQPRKNLGDITELMASVKEHGLLQPIVAQALGGDRYQVIAGERRFTAAKRGGLTVVPCIIRTVSQQNVIELQLVENLHRKELDPFEEAEGYRRLKEEHNYTDAEIAKRMGKSRTTITEMLGLVRIPEEVRRECRNSDKPISRDTLYLLARQKAPEEMEAVLQEARAGTPQAIRREVARTGVPRTVATSSAPAKKPKWAVSSEELHGTVVVQSHDSRLPLDRKIALLKHALREAQKNS